MTSLPRGHPVKRRTADRAEWARITHRRFSAARVDDDDFTGHVALLQIDGVSEPFIGPRSGLRLADAGFEWLTHFARGAHHTVTTMYDDAGQVIQWYIDICLAQGIDEAGVPWFDDLYLDIIVYPDGRVVVLDEEELDAALAAGVITREDHALAWREARHLLALLDRQVLGPAVLARRSAAHRNLLLEQGERSIPPAEAADAGR